MLIFNNFSSFNQVKKNLSDPVYIVLVIYARKM